MKLTVNQINYYFEPVQKYGEAINNADTLEKLMDVLNEYELIAWDGLDVAKTFGQKEFKQFKKWLNIERKGKYAGDKSAKIIGPILMPEIMFKISMIEQKFSAPWGTCFIRLKEVGKLEIKNDRVICLW